jgi:hypothetical protein
VNHHPFQLGGGGGGADYVGPDPEDGQDSGSDGGPSDGGDGGQADGQDAGQNGDPWDALPGDYDPLVYVAVAVGLVVILRG